MPTYCYRTSEGKVHDRTFPPGEAPDQIFITFDHYGRRKFATRDRQAEGVFTSVRATENPTHQPRRGAWPMKPCYASGVHPEQAQELRDHLKDRGCPTEITSSGDPIYTSPRHRKKALKCRGMNDANAFS